MSKIVSIKARKILDSRGEWTLETTVTTDSAATASVSVPRGKSRGKFEAASVSVDEAVRNTDKVIAPALKGVRADEQIVIDKHLLELDGTPNKSALGGNTILGTSLACARAAATSEAVPLWRYLRDLSGLPVHEAPPRLFINVINGGLHAGNNLDFQEYLIIPTVSSMSEAVRLGEMAYIALREFLVENFGKSASLLGDEGGFAPNFRDNLEPLEILERSAADAGLLGKLKFGLDASASNISKDSEELKSIYQELRTRHNLWYLEDPFGENEFDKFANLLKDWPDGLICGDDLTVTNAGRMKTAAERKSVNAIIVKPNQIGTLTETLAAVKQAREYGWKVIVSHRSGETNDDFIADLAFGVGADGFKLGAPARGERVAKFNRLLAIEADGR